MAIPLEEAHTEQAATGRAGREQDTAHLEGRADLIVAALNPIGLLAASANVIMQLSHPAVGYGVVESDVESGQLFKHPIKRTRTTMTYLAVALMGTPEEKLAYRKAVNRSHASVRSRADSPVKYNAFDRDLQLWVAACLYKGLEDLALLTRESIDDHEDYYQQGAALGTTLQMPLSMWPKDRQAFEEYWQASLQSRTIDDTVRSYLLAIASLKFAGRRASRLLGSLGRVATAGFLPEELRDQMQLPWGPREQARFARVTRVMRAADRFCPYFLRIAPLQVCLWDLRYRMRHHKPLV